MPIENTNSRFGLKPITIEKIQNIFIHYPAIEKAILYGSRTSGAYHSGSDIDLTLVGQQLNYDQLIKIATEIDDLLLPYKVDLSLYHSISNPNLIANINKMGQIFYES